MAPVLPLRLLGREKEHFYVFDPRDREVTDFDIISFRWGDTVDEYSCGIDGVHWNVKICPDRLEDIKSLMIRDNVQYMWVDCVCINQCDDWEKSVEIARMSEYYKSARKCYILIQMVEVWGPHDIVDNLRFIDHILSHIGGAALASEAMLTENLTKRLSEWANKRDWSFPMNKADVQSAAIEMGLLNCYSTSIKNVWSLFQNPYFSRVWTFQEMLLGKNITMWGINEKQLSCIGELNTWMDLATDAKDKAHKLQEWIERCRVLKSSAVNAILRIIEEDNKSLGELQTQVKGISSARIDIVNGGPSWWYENHKGISNIFSAISITPRECRDKEDIFKGLLGVFSGLFTPEEIHTELGGTDIEAISFAFFRQLSIKTGYAWTRLAISSQKRGAWDWIPVVAYNPDHPDLMTTDCFAGVVKLGMLRSNGLAKAPAVTGIRGAPRQYMKILLRQEHRSGGSGSQFVFRGCNCGTNVRTGLFSTEPIPTHDQPQDIAGDETGRILVQCATMLGSIMDPDGDLVDFRRRLLRKLRPTWKFTDRNAKPAGWIDRCVSGTWWEHPDPHFIRVHNMSANYRMVDVTGCNSNLHNESTKDIVCDVRVKCGCTIVAPFSWIMEAITAVDGSFLGDGVVNLDKDNRIVLQDGLGLVQVGDVGRAFHLVSFEGKVDAHGAYASRCRSTRLGRPVEPKLEWPVGRALVREEFRHTFTDVMRDYGYVETGGSGNLLLYRSHPASHYKVIGVCIDEYMTHKKPERFVTIQ